MIMGYQKPRDQTALILRIKKIESSVIELADAIKAVASITSDLIDRIEVLEKSKVKRAKKDGNTK